MEKVLLLLSLLAFTYATKEEENTQNGKRS